MTTQHLRPNFTRVKAGVYEVRTQAGFRQALKEYKGEDDDDLNIQDVSDWPTEYPSLVTFTIGYMGYRYIQVREIPFRLITKLLKPGENNVS